VEGVPEPGCLLLFAIVGLAASEYWALDTAMVFSAIPDPGVFRPVLPIKKIKKPPVLR
jgi:hypothetical protein